MVNKRLQKLAIAVSCLGLMNNSSACEQEKEKGFTTLLSTIFNKDDGSKFYSCNTTSSSETFRAENKKIMFQAKDYRLYVCDPRFKHKVSISKGASLGAELRDIDCLDIDDSCISIGRTNITNDEEVGQFCDFVYFLQETAERRSQSIQSSFAFLTNFNSHTNLKFIFTRHSENQYILTSGYNSEDVFHSQYEFFLRDETEEGILESSMYDRSIYDSFCSIQFPEKSKMILEKVKFLEWEYTLKNRCYVLNGESLSYVNTRLDGLVARLPNFAPSSISDFKTAGARILDEVFSSIERELKFVESLPEEKLQSTYDDYAYMQFLNYVRSGGRPNRFSLIAHNIILRKSDK